jgi:hypothetical protein
MGSAPQLAGTNSQPVQERKETGSIGADRDAVGFYQSLQN